MDEQALNEAVERAQSGDAAALEAVVRAVQDDVYDLALRILGHPDDACDACQEALIRVMTKLSTFRGESRFRTWVYRVAANSLLNYRGQLHMREQSFDDAGMQLDMALGQSLDIPDSMGPERDALVDEVKLVCTHGMLLCLDRAHRLAYVLGVILELSSEEAAAILDITPEAFRKRLSRAREELEAFLQSHCGLASPANRCRCSKLLPAALAVGLVNPARLAYKQLPTREVDRLRLDVEKIRTAAEIFRSQPKYSTPEDFASAVRGWLATSN